MSAEDADEGGSVDSDPMVFHPSASTVVVGPEEDAGEGTWEITDPMVFRTSEIPPSGRLPSSTVVVGPDEDAGDEGGVVVDPMVFHPSEAPTGRVPGWPAVVGVVDICPMVFQPL
jgi:hypothetical protein